MHVLASKHLASLRAWAGQRSSTPERNRHLLQSETGRTTENGDMAPDGRFGRRAKEARCLLARCMCTRRSREQGRSPDRCMRSAKGMAPPDGAVCPSFSHGLFTLHSNRTDHSTCALIPPSVPVCVWPPEKDHWISEGIVKHGGWCAAAHGLAHAHTPNPRCNSGL